MKIKSIVIGLILLTLVLISFVLFFNVREPTKIPNLTHEIPLRAGKMINFLLIPDEFYLNIHNPNALTIYVEYPEMRPNTPKESFSKDKTIKIYLTLDSVSGTDNVKSFLKHVEGSECEIKGNCYARKVKSEDKYEVFQHGKQNDFAEKNNKSSKYYLFNGYDEQLILLEDLGTWAQTYKITRNIDSYLLIEYQIPKSLGKDLSTTNNDLIVVDKAATTFIQNHLKYSKFKQENPYAN